MEPRREKCEGIHPETAGFSLIETVLSLFLLAVLVSASAHSFLHLAPKYRLQSAVWDVQSRLNYARYKAIFEGSKVRVRFGPSTIMVETYNTAKKTWVQEPERLLEGVVVEANNRPTFHPNGNVSNLASIIVANSWGRHKITIAISGRIKTIKLD